MTASSKTTVPTEWLVKLEELIEKVTTIYSESTTENYNLGALSAHFKASKYFTEQPSEKLDKCTCPDDQCLLGDHPTCRWKEFNEQQNKNVELEEFAKWWAIQDNYYSLVDLEFKKYENNVWNDVPFSEVVQAFKNRNKQHN